MSWISISVAPSALALSIASFVTALPLSRTIAAMVSSAFILLLTGAVIILSFTFCEVSFSPNKTSAAAVWAAVQNLHWLPLETTVAINSRSASVKVLSPRSKIWVSSRIGAAAFLSYSSKPVIPGKCSSNGIYGMKYYLSWWCITPASCKQHSKEKLK